MKNKNHFEIILEKESIRLRLNKKSKKIIITKGETDEEFKNPRQIMVSYSLYPSSEELVELYQKISYHFFGEETVTAFRFNNSSSSISLKDGFLLIDFSNFVLKMQPKDFSKALYAVMLKNQLIEKNKKIILLSYDYQKNLDNF